MKRSYRITAMAFVFCGFFLICNVAQGMAAPAKEMVYEKISAKSLSDSLTMQGIQNQLRTNKGDSYLLLKFQGKNSLVMFFQCKKDFCGTIRITTPFKLAGAMDLKKVNKWNHSKNFTRAYLDKDGDVILESDLDLDGGVPMTAVDAVFNRHEKRVTDFLAYAKINSKSTPTAGRPRPRQDLPEKKKAQILTPPVPVRPPPASGGFQLKVTALSADHPAGCPVILEATSAMDVAVFKPVLRLYYATAEGERSLRKTFLYYEMKAGQTQPDFKTVPADCEAVLRAEVEKVAECATATGVLADCQSMIDIDPDTILPLTLRAASTKKTTTKPKSVAPSPKQEVVIKLVGVEERMSGCKIYVEAKNNTNMTFEQFTLKVKTVGADGPITIDPLMLGGSGDPDFPKPMPAGELISTEYYALSTECTSITGAVLMPSVHCIAAGGKKLKGCYDLIRVDQGSVIPLRIEKK
jgi:hypothetical protein